VFSFLIGNSIEPLSIFSIVFVFLIFVSKYKDISKNTRQKLIIIFFAILFGSLPLFLSGGNIKRLNSDKILTLNTDVNILIENFFIITRTYIKKGETLYTLIFILLPILINKKIKYSKEIGTIYIYSALTTILPMSLIFSQENFYTEPRASLFFLVFSSIGIILYFGNEYKNSVFIEKIKKIFYVISIVVLIFSIGSEINTNRDLFNQFERREEEITMQKSNQLDNYLIIEPIIKRKNSVIFLNDIKEDSENWINNCVAKYYGVEKIKVK